MWHSNRSIRGQGCLPEAWHGHLARALSLDITTMAKMAMPLGTTRSMRSVRAFHAEVLKKDVAHHLLFAFVLARFHLLEVLTGFCGLRFVAHTVRHCGNVIPAFGKAGREANGRLEIRKGARQVVLFLARFSGGNVAQRTRRHALLGGAEVA